MSSGFGRICVLLAFLLAGAPALAEDVNRAVSLDMTTDWQPPGGAFRFVLSPELDAGAANPMAYLCPTQLGDDYFPKGETVINRAAGDQAAKKADDEPALRAVQAAACVQLTVRRLANDAATPSTSIFQAALPAHLSQGFVGVADTYFFGLDNGATNGLFRQLITGGWLHVRVDAGTAAWFKVGVTSRWLAALAALTILLLFGRGLAGFARTQRVVGPGNPSKTNILSLPIRLISGSDGRASLSQFQIMLWTFVVIGGGVYVVVLNGALIPISAGTLVLLGISGAAAVIAQAKDSQKAITPTATQKPGNVQDVMVQVFTESPDLVVTWSPPADASPISQYRVKYSSADGETFVMVRDNGVRLVGLEERTSYAVSLRAENGTALGDWVVATGAAGAKIFETGPPEKKPGDPAPALAPKLDRVNVVLDKVTETTIALEWTPPDNQSPYDAQVRRADSLEDWVNPPCLREPNNNKSIVVTGLDSGVVYNFRVCKSGFPGEWSKPVRASTLHRPRWSDLVTEADQPNQIEVTRVQMLLFTIVTAGFVTIKIADLGVIPEIPPEYLVLMGISNSVYLSNKWARR